MPQVSLSRPGILHANAGGLIWGALSLKAPAANSGICVRDPRSQKRDLGHLIIYRGFSCKGLAVTSGLVTERFKRLERLFSLRPVGNDIEIELVVARCFCVFLEHTLRLG